MKESLDSLQGYDLRFPQARDGYRFSLDPLLLCAFAEIDSRARVIDLGTGSGVIPQLLARMGKGREWVGLELQSALVERARRSVCLNGLAERVHIEVGDVRALPVGWRGESFDAVVTNPPYRPPSRGRVSPGAERGLARFELAGGLTDFLRAAAFLLKDGGRCYIVYLAERLAELLDEMRTFRLEPKRLRLVHSRSGAPARLVLVEGRKNGRPGLTVEAPLMIYRGGTGRDYHEEIRTALGLGDAALSPDP
jgi:tRNA1Val (adenine37-N6)-methyltransferase